MSVTAARIGASPLRLDWSNTVSRTGDSSGVGGIGGGSAAMALADAWSTLKARFVSGEVGFFHAPVDGALSHSAESQAMAANLLAQQKFTDCLFLGIGGSALGPISVLSALRDKTSPAIRFHFMENPDAIDWRTTLARLNPETTLVCCVTKSGTTFETMAQFMLALQWLGKSRWESHVVAITDPKKGDLREFAAANRIPTLAIAPSIGGRFSIFSPVGLFPMALAGLSVPEFLRGATEVRDHVERAAPDRNPLFLLASELLRQYPRRSIHVCMPYLTELRSFSSWFVQLWAESLGKDLKGFTPLAALGATDQHSILQLLRDGPDDKVTFFITVDQIGDTVSIPRKTEEFSRFPAFRILEGHSLHDLLRIEYQATSLVLTKRGRPHFTLQMDALNERSCGALYFATSVLTAITGTLWGVNPFDQPGVEEGKVYIREALSQPVDTPDPVDFDQTPVGRLRRHRNDD